MSFKIRICRRSRKDSLFSTILGTVSEATGVMWDPHEPPWIALWYPFGSLLSFCGNRWAPLTRFGLPGAALGIHLGSLRLLWASNFECWGQIWAFFGWYFGRNFCDKAALRTVTHASPLRAVVAIKSTIQQRVHPYTLPTSIHRSFPQHRACKCTGSH